MGHTEYIKRLLKQFGKAKNRTLYQKKYLGSTIGTMKEGKQIEDNEVGEGSKSV